jgi:hypothetical protein
MHLDALAKNIEESYLRDHDGLLAPKCYRLEERQRTGIIRRHSFRHSIFARLAIWLELHA